MDDFKENDDDISIGHLFIKLKYFCHYLLKRWVILLVGGFIGGGLGVVYALLSKPNYTAESTFVLEESEKGGLGQYAGIASAVGLDIGAGGSNGLFQSDNIIELYKSREMLKQTFLSEANFNGKRTLLIDRYVNFNNLREKWKGNKELYGIKFMPFNRKSSFLQDSVLFSIIKDIKKNYLTVAKPDKKLSIISVKLVSKDELFAKEFVSIIVGNVNSFYTKYKTKKSSDNLNVLKKQADSVRRILNSSIVSVADAQDYNPKVNLAKQSLRTPSQKRQIDVQANSAIYVEVEKNLFLTKVSLLKETPLIQVIDKPELPLDVKKISVPIACVFGGIIGAFITIFYLALKKLSVNK